MIRRLVDLARVPRHLVSSVAIQGLGAAATFGCGIAIAAWQGPEAQGRYGLLRSSADLLLAVLLFGLPQSMVNAMNRRGTRPAALERMSIVYAAALLAVAVLLVAAVALAPAEDWLPSWIGGPFAALALLVGTIGWLLQNLFRVFALCRGTAVQFAWSSVLPALTLLVGVIALQVVSSQRFELAIAASGIASAVLAAWQLRGLRANAGWSSGSSAGLSTLLSDGGYAFVQNATIALQTWVTLQLMVWRGASVAEVGQFVFAAYVFQAFALPTSFIAPLLFARISAAGGANAKRPFAVKSLFLRLLGWSVPAAVLVAAALPLAVPALFGTRYAQAVPAGVVLAFAGPFLVLNRLGVSVLFGEGRFRLASVHAVLRAAVIPAAMLAVWFSDGFGAGFNVATGAAIGWLIAEMAGVLLLAWAWKSTRRLAE